jgi:competence protein ComEA
MRSRSLAAQHDAVVARRLELLTTELASVRDRDSVPDDREPARGQPGLHGPAQLRAVRHHGPDGTLDVDAAGEVSGPEPMTARMPGRHASRRSALSWVLGLSEGARGRFVLGAGQLAVVAVLAVIGLVLTCWWLVRSSGHEVVAPATVSTPRRALVTPSLGVSTGAPARDSPAGGAKPEVVVDVTGKVRHPGIAVLRQGARVIDALRAAGGARPGVDLGGLNLARVLTDGEQVVVGRPVAAGPVPSTSDGGAPVNGLVNINTADETTLESLPEVGPVTAQAIITWRSQHGGFASVDQLLDVDGIGDATLAKLTPYVTI